MQYYTPDAPRFVGDCMPFYHNGVFHLYYLLDENHHQTRGGLGVHQWAHASSADLREWRHHPLAIPAEEEWEGSICTGSVFHHQGVFHAFYATRKPDWTQHLCHASSRDGIHFQKSRPIPLAPVPPGYDPLHFRDPFCFQDEEGRFHLLVTARLADYPLKDQGGCLLRLQSDNLTDWTPTQPFLIPGGRGYGGIPECPDLFYWNGWHYLLFGLGLTTHYRMARHPLGPWLRLANDLLDSPLLSVMKTAPFTGDRRLAAGWVGTREGDRDTGSLQWGGCAVFRELVQHPDGILSTRFVPEMIPAHEKKLSLAIKPLTSGVVADGDSLSLDAVGTEAVAEIGGLPQDYLLRCRVSSERDNALFGLGLRGEERCRSGYRLLFDPGLQRVALEDQTIHAVREIIEDFDLEVICRGDILDVCIAQRRCLINRLPEKRGDSLTFFCEGGRMHFRNIAVYPIIR